MDVLSSWTETAAELHGRWPEVQLDAASYARCLERLDSSTPSGPRAAELALVCACLDGNICALQALERDFILPARGAVAKVRPAPDFVAEILQRLRIKLLTGEAPRLGSYTAAGPLAAWIRMSATRLALDEVRGKRNLQASSEELNALTTRLIEPHKVLDDAAHRPQLQAALEKAFAALSARERSLLRMHALQGMSIDEIAVPYKVHRATVARWIQATHRQLLDTVRDELQLAYPQLNTAGFDSLVGAVQSQLQLSFARLLASQPEPQDGST